MDEEEFDSIADRQKASRARVHTELTATARERIVYISANPLDFTVPDPEELGNIPRTFIRSAVSSTYEDVGTSAIRSNVNLEMSSDIGIHDGIISSCESFVVFAYLENLLEIVYRRSSLKWDMQIPTTFKDKNFGKKNMVIKHFTEKCANRINKVLETEGELWELEFEQGDFNFRPIGSEMMAEADESFNSVASGKRWTSIASPYNDAYTLYRDQTYSREIPEKLYNSIEELARTICVDFEGWMENRELNLSKYLSKMREKDLFEPNPIMRAELDDLVLSMEKSFQKAGDERHNRHHEIDREYCTLMLHQTSAYIVYIIRQYENKHISD